MSEAPKFTRKGRTLLPGQVAELTVIDREAGTPQVIFSADEIIEAPNWTPDGKALVFNAGGEMWRIPADGSAAPEKIDTGAQRDLNNDHVLSPDGGMLYLSSNNGHLYGVPLRGGEPRRISNVHATPHHYYLHGISPDGQTLSYVAVEGAEGQKRVNIFTIPSAGGPDHRLTDVSYPNDGRNIRRTGSGSIFRARRRRSGPGTPSASACGRTAAASSS